MAKNIFRFVWRDRAVGRIAESATQKVYENAEKTAAKTIATMCFKQLEEERRAHLALAQSSAH